MADVKRSIVWTPLASCQIGLCPDSVLVPIQFEVYISREVSHLQQLATTTQPIQITQLSTR